MIITVAFDKLRQRITTALPELKAFTELVEVNVAFDRLRQRPIGSGNNY
jgi:hypothetical protein